MGCRSKAYNKKNKKKKKKRLMRICAQNHFIPTPARILVSPLRNHFIQKKKILNRSLLWQRAERRATSESVCVCRQSNRPCPRNQTGLHQKSAVIWSVNGTHTHRHPLNENTHHRMRKFAICPSSSLYVSAILECNSTPANLSCFLHYFHKHSKLHLVLLLYSMKLNILSLFPIGIYAHRKL